MQKITRATQTRRLLGRVGGPACRIMSRNGVVLAAFSVSIIFLSLTLPGGDDKLKSITNDLAEHVVQLFSCS